MNRGALVAELDQALAWMRLQSLDGEPQPWLARLEACRMALTQESAHRLHTPPEPKETRP